MVVVEEIRKLKCFFGKMLKYKYKYFLTSIGVKYAVLIC